MTECNRKDLIFHGLGRRDVVARFDGGAITSDAGGVLLRELEERTGILQRFADCFTDHRDADLIEHTVLDLVKQRTFGLTLGYEDLNDHDAATGGFDQGGEFLDRAASKRSRVLRTNRPRRAARPAVVGAGRQDRSDRSRSSSPAGPRQSLGGQEHAEPVGADAAGCRCRQPLQEDRGRLWSHRAVLRRCVSGLLELVKELLPRFR